MYVECSLIAWVEKEIPVQVYACTGARNITDNDLVMGP